MIIAVAVVAIICIAAAAVLLTNDKSDNEDNNAQTTITVWGSTTVTPLMVKFQEAYENETNVRLNVGGNGSGEAVPALRNGTAQIGMLSRELNSSEANGTTALEIAGDAVVIIVDKDANISNLTLEQVAKIYNGEYTNWSQVGGANLKINPLIREANSGTRSCIDEFMAGALGITVPDLAAKYTSYATHNSTGEMLTHANSVSGAIGYVNLGNLPDVNKSSSNVNSISIDGVVPSPATVDDKSYPISRGLILATLGEPTGEVKAFLDWIMSPAGQTIVEQADFVPVGPTS